MRYVAPGDGFDCGWQLATCSKRYVAPGDGFDCGWQLATCSMRYVAPGGGFACHALGGYRDCRVPASDQKGRTRAPSGLP
ncbi:hypothetical protein, partial [Acerihabitans sp.]|uniref:hypothetical protein n=1 Tax=Acerihabitans sp. TaxID=2811394 RepID=UPI002ED7F710